jgi:tetratricopeptide (TPR) repeat protein
MKRRLDEQPVDHGVFENQRVQAFRHPFVAKMLGGPVFRDPKLAQFRHKRGDEPSDSFDDAATYLRYLQGDWGYFGAKSDHFGHILAEMIHRILPTKLFFPELRQYLILTAIDDSSSVGIDSLCPTFREVLDFFEIDPQSILVLNEDVVVERLSICEQGSCLGGKPNPWYLQALGEFSTKRLNKIHGTKREHTKVFVSKSRLPHGGKILGLGYIEEVLRKDDFFIFYPEEVPLTRQLDIYRKAREIVFEEGSACHGAQLLGRDVLNRSFLIARRRDHAGMFADVLRSHSKSLEFFSDSYFLGTIIVNAAEGFPHSEFGVSLLDLDRFVNFFRQHGLAKVEDIDIRRYFEAAEEDLKKYFAFHASAGIEVTDLWRVSEVRLEFEKLRQSFLHGRASTPLDLPSLEGSSVDADTVAAEAWSAHAEGRWLDAVRLWEVFRDRFPHSEEGFTFGSIALIELGRFYEADAVLRVGMDRFPHSADVSLYYALVAHHRRDWRDAAVRWETYRAKFPPAEAGYRHGLTALFELRRYEEADELALQALQLFPGDGEFLASRTWAAQAKVDLQEQQQR